MAAPRKYPDELRERAIRLVLDAKAAPDGGGGNVYKRIEVRELRRANAILKSASAFFAAELDRPNR